MPDQLVIYLHHNAEHASFILLDQQTSTYRTSAGEIAVSAHPKPLSELPTALIADKAICVIVPAEDVSLMTTTLPPLNRSKLLQALPFALEDQLIDDLESLHFAIGEPSDGQVPVAVVARTKMQQWLEQLANINIIPDQLLPATLCIPVEANHWHIQIQDIAIVRTGPYAGFAGDKDNLNELLNLALLSTTLRPELIHIHNYTEDAFAKKLSLSIPIQEDFIQANEMLAHMAHAAEKYPTINLLQGTFVSKRAKLPQLNKLWRMATYLSIAFVALLFIYPAVSYFILRGKVNEINTQIATLYHHHFPEAKAIIAPRVRLEEKLAKARAQIGENRFLLLAGYVGDAMAAANNIKIKRLDYQNNQFTLQLTAASENDFSTFTDYLTQHGLRVKQQSANLVESRIDATLLIE